MMALWEMSLDDLAERIGMHLARCTHEERERFWRLARSKYGGEPMVSSVRWAEPEEKRD